MAVLDEVATYLAANVTDTALVVGTNLLLGRMPEDPSTCVALFETGGRTPVDAFGASTLPAYARPRFQALVRAVSYPAAEALATDVWRWVQKIDNDTLTGVLWLRASAVQSPFALQRDDRDRMVFSCNYQVDRVVT
jgi:hypothetical protein